MTLGVSFYNIASLSIPISHYIEIVALNARLIASLRTKHTNIHYTRYVNYFIYLLTYLLFLLRPRSGNNIRINNSYPRKVIYTSFISLYSVNDTMSISTLVVKYNSGKTDVVIICSSKIQYGISL